MRLNQGQSNALDQLQSFLGSEDKYFCLSGGAGVGKTYLLNTLYNRLGAFNDAMQVMGLPTFQTMEFTATTNKASSLFMQESSTIHSYLGLRVQDDYKTGKSRAVTSAQTRQIHKTIVVVDESSMLDPNLLAIIDKWIMASSKVIFVGDQYQLPPVGHDAPTAFAQGYALAELTEPMRQGADTHLYKVCQHLRQCVIDQKYRPIPAGEGVTLVQADGFLDAAVASFKKGEDSRVISFKNKSVESLNGYIRGKLHDTAEFTKGDIVVARSSMEGVLKLEETYTIEVVDARVYQDYGLDLYKVRIHGEWFPVPVKKQALFNRIKASQREGRDSGNWATYFTLKNAVLDIRDGFACTAHSSQGSTYDKVFLDFADLCTCTDLNVFLRMLYVAFTRARKEVVIYGI